MALSYGHGSVASHCTYPTVGTYAFLREEGSSPGIWRLRAGQWWRYNHHSYHHYSIITNALTLPLDCDCHLLQSLSVSSPSHTEHLQFCHSTRTHFLLSVTLTLATFLPLSASDLLRAGVAPNFYQAQRHVAAPYPQPHPWFRGST